MKNEKEIKSIAILGLGLENISLLRIFDKHKLTTKITVCDFRNKKNLPPLDLRNIKVDYRLEENFNKNLFDFDLLFRSPGWPLSCPGIKEAIKYKSIISSPMNFFLENCPTKNIIGVTGSKGKGTTATLIYKIIENSLKEKKSKAKVYLGGNIGIAPLSFLEKIKKDDFVVLELSSFQLEDLKYSPRISVLTNIFKEHLSPADPNNPNYHSSEKKYFQAKLNIAAFKENLYLVANSKLKTKIDKIKTNKPQGKVLYFSKNDNTSKLVGDFNQENIAAAELVVKLLKIKSSVIKKTINNFKNLEHRLELVLEKDGRRFFDNSFSTTPESTIADLKSFSSNLIQIAGGADKGADFKNLAKTIKEKTNFLILLPGVGTERLKKELNKINFSKNLVFEARDMKEAVLKAKKESIFGSVILLSTACASFGLFKNYKERGDLFKKYVKE